MKSAFITSNLMKYLKDIWSSLLGKGPIGLIQSILAAQLIFSSNLLAQDALATLAVVDFEGRGISQLEAQTLTDRFRSSVGNTGAIRLVERRMMEEVLTEQGFQQSGCTSDECAVEVGQLLGVQYMVGGAVGKVGDTFTIDARMISVETGASIRTRNVSYVGKVDGLIIEIEVLAYEMMEMKPPEDLLERRKLGTPVVAPPVVKTKMGAMMRSLVFPGLGQFYSGKKLWGFGWVLSELAVAGVIYTSYTSYQTAYNDFNTYMDLYRQETNTTLIVEYKGKAKTSEGDMKTANDQMKMLAGVAGGLWLVNAIHAFFIGPKAESANLNKKTSIKLAYHPTTGQAQLKLEIALD